MYKLLKKLLSINSLSDNKDIIDAYMEGYEKGKKDGYFEYIRTNVTPNHIRAAFGFDPIKQKEFYHNYVCMIAIMLLNHCPLLRLKNGLLVTFSRALPTFCEIF